MKTINRKDFLYRRQKSVSNASGLWMDESISSELHVGESMEHTHQYNIW